ncbi:MAG TPA: glycoside hydrolase family 6 protein [Streptosporangiaceae bacterium]|nr:glycoside hydrolase family 6 protein [Streptosporangiaceae bacterium]
MAAAAAGVVASALVLVGVAGPASAARVPNPFAGAQAYVNPAWAENARSSGGSAIANQPTFVWMDRIAAIEGANGAMGLREHLDAAVSQGATLFQMVTYNLPGRDCSALASNGELKLGELNRYKAEFIDPIADILSDPAYANLRIVNVVEIDSLPNLITNTNGRPSAAGTTCDQALQSGDYVNGVAYALGTLGAIPNVYNYVDIGHHGWLGWDDNFQPFANLMGQVVRTSPATPDSLHGFASNVANYGPLHEPFFTVNDVVGGRPIREVGGGWIDWNRFVDEVSYVRAYQPVLSAAVGHNVSMIIDTSRNGWGGPNRPTARSSSTDPITFMNESRIDRRIHLGNWCNQSGAGLGARPAAAPEAGVDAYVWVKPPGESDGASQEIPNDEGKGFDQMCDPAYGGNVRNGNNASGALPGAPLSGHWFDAQFRELLANANPAL